MHRDVRLLSSITKLAMTKTDLLGIGEHCPRLVRQLAAIRKPLQLTRVHCACIATR